MALKELRNQKGLTQVACAEYLQIPVRTYKRYESDESRIDTIKYRYILDKLETFGRIDEEHGILSLDQIKSICNDIFKSYPVEICYLFGSYARGEQTELSDVDLLVFMPVNGLLYYELAETLREKLCKKVDLLDSAQIDKNPLLAKEILKDGIRIYG